MSFAMALAESSHHTSRGQRVARAGGEEHEKHFTAEFRTTPPPAAAGTVCFRLDDDEVPAAGCWLPALIEPRPQGKLEQHAGSGFELVLALAAPVQQVIEEAAAFEVLHELPVLQEQMIVQETSAASALLCRATQPLDVEQVLDVPVLHMDEGDSILYEFLEQVALQEIPEVQVPSSGAVVVQEQVIVQSLPEAGVSRQRVQQRSVEQVLDALCASRNCGTDGGCSCTWSYFLGRF